MNRRISLPAWRPLAWVFLPLLLGALYALAYPLFAPEPDASNMPPGDAVLVFRYRDFAALDDGHVFTPPPVPWSDVIGSENNVPGLPGVDRTAPVYVIQLPPNLRHDSSLVVFPLEDAERFERAFMDPKMIERGFTRRPKQLEIHGRWAAVGPDRDSVRRIGTGTLVCEDRGESWSLAADVSGVAALALVESSQPVWRSALKALGVDFDGVRVEVNLESGRQEAAFPDTQRLSRIVRSWDTARLWAFAEERRVEIELRPNPGTEVAESLRLAQDDDAGVRPPSPPPRDALLWLWIPSAPALGAFQQTLFAAGVDIPAAWLDAAPPGGVLVIGTRSPKPYAVTWTVVTPEGAPLDLSPLLGDLPAVGTTRPLAAGEAPLTVIDTEHDRTAPAGDVRHARDGGFDLVGVGGATSEALARMSTQIKAAEPFVPPQPPREGLRLVAAFRMDASRAEKVLGRALSKGGLFAVLAGGPVEGAVWTDGQHLVVHARVGETP